MARSRRIAIPAPEYVVPTMEEARAVPDCGLRVLSTFTGCGGSCLGFRLAGFQTIWASEFVAPARDTYAANFPGVPLDARDIRDVKPEDVLRELGLAAGDVDVMEGSPPCASFSMSGKRERSWGKAEKYSETVQRVDDLFWEFARFVDGVRPKVFVAENVKGLVTGKAKGYFLEIREKLTSLGYRVGAKVLDAQWLGVPQRRERLVFVGVREDLQAVPAFPTPLPYRFTIRDALPGLRVHTKRGALRSTEPAPTVQTHGNRHTFSEMTAVADLSIERYAIGAEWKKLREGESSDRYFNLVRPDRRQPCPTVTQMGGQLGAASVTHPTEPRKFTIDELRRICSFPPDFALTGTYAQQWERLGRAVPPLMMRAVAETIRDDIFRKLAAT